MDDNLARVLGRWIDLAMANASPIVWGTLAITVLLSVYAALNLGFNSDTVSLVGEELESRRNHEAFSALFPNLENAVLVVVDGETPELARSAAEGLAAALEERTEAFTSVYLPGGGAFFEHNGLMYRSVDDLWEFADQLSGVQPVLSELEQNPRISNFAALARRGLEQAQSDEMEGGRWADVLDRVGQATVSVYEEYPLEVSWEEVLLRGSSIDLLTRRVIVTHPVLDFDDAWAAGVPMRAIREEADRLGLSAERGVSVRITGNPALNYEEMIGLAWDIGGAGVFCFLLVAFILYRGFRSWKLAVASIATLLVGLLWTAAWAAAAVGHLNVISISFGILFIGLGVDFCIHLAMRYADLLRGGLDHAAAMREASRSVGGSLVICGATTAIGFIVFVPTVYTGVAELGLISAGGMVVILFLTITFFPAIVTTWLRPEPANDLTGDVVFRSTWWRWFERRPAAVCWTALGTFILSLALTPLAYFDPNAVAVRDQSTVSVQAFNDLLAQTGTSSPWYVDALAPDLEAAEELAERLEALDVVSETLVLSDYVPVDQEEKLEILNDLAFMMDPSGGGPGIIRDAPSVDEQVESLRALYQLLDDTWMDQSVSALGTSMRHLRDQLGTFLIRAEQEGNAEAALASLEQILLASLPEQVSRLRTGLDARPITMDSLPPELVRRMLAPNGAARVQIFPTATLQDDESFRGFVDGVRVIAPKATGIAVNLLEFGRACQQAFTQALVSAFVLITLILLVMWRSVRDTALALTPLVLAGVATTAFMVAIDAPFNFVNIIVIPLLFGIGIDSGIHLVHRSKSLRIEASEGLLETTTARAVFYSALTTTASFGSLAFSSHLGMRSLGLMLVAGMLITIASNLIVLPALIQIATRRS